MCQMLLEDVVHSLYEHCVQPHLPQEEGHGGRVAKGINGPASLWHHTWGRGRGEGGGGRGERGEGRGERGEEGGGRGNNVYPSITTDNHP